MTGMGMSVSIIGDDRGVQKMLMVLDTALNPLAIAGFLGAEVTPYLALRAKSRFADEGDDVVGAWAPLRESTKNFRRTGRLEGLWSVGDEHPINVRTHELENYITSGIGNVIPSPAGTVLQYPSPRTVNKGLREKVKTAQQGRGQPHIVRRPVLGLNERDLAFVLTALAFHIKKVGKRP